jgi:anti-anti-sigma factor
MSGEDGVVWFLRTSERDLGAAKLVIVDGRVSRATAAELGRAPAGGDGLRGLVVDLSGVDYINGIGLQVLEQAAARLRQGHVELLICGVRPAVQAAFDLAGAIPNLFIVDSRDAALVRCERPASGGG